MNTEDRSRRLILFAVAALIGGTALAWGLYLVRDALTLVYLSGMIALGLSPIVTWLEKPSRDATRRTPRWAAVLVLYLCLAVLVVGIYLIIVPPFADQVRDLVANMPDHLTEWQRWLVRHHLQQRVFTVAELLERGPSPNSAVTGVLGVVRGAAGAVLAVFTAVLLSVYFLLDGERLFLLYLRALPTQSRVTWLRVSADVASKVSAWMSGQAFLCVLIGVTAGLGFWLIGLPYFYVLALVCAVGELVPIVGPIVAAIPCVIVASTVGLNTAVITAIYLFVQQQVENNIVIPRLMKQQTGVSPLIVMVAILVGGELLGVIGALLAVPTAAVIQTFIREYLESKETA